MSGFQCPPRLLKGAIIGLDHLTWKSSMARFSCDLDKLAGTPGSFL
jgi:hypothetical protein